MRHRRKGTRLNRKSNQLKALLRNLVTSLVLNGEMITTQAKAKAIIPVFDRLVVNIRKKDEMNGIRVAQKVLFGQTAQKKLVQEIVPGLEGRPSGFLGLLKLGSRKGDMAPIVRVTILTSAKVAEKTQIAKVDDTKDDIVEAEIVEKKEKKVPKKTSAKKTTKTSTSKKIEKVEKSEKAEESKK